MKLSIVIPMRNEASELPGLLQHLCVLRECAVEILLVDGGSQDGSASLARDAGFEVLDARAGRAHQMNAGAYASCGDTLLFLHADSRLPQTGVNAIAAALHTHCWGRFDVRIMGKPLALRFVAAAMNLRSRLTGIATGDQGIFMTRDAFNAVGGFPEQPLMEDIEICRALKSLGPPACLAQRIETSGRRWERCGVFRTILLMWWLRWRYWRGTSADKIARAYR